MSFLNKILSVFTKSVPSDSASGKVNTTDIAKVARTGIIMGLSTAATYILANVSPDMFGQHSAIAAVVLTILGELSVRFLKNNEK